MARSSDAFGWLALSLAVPREVRVRPDASGTGTVFVDGERFGPQALVRVIAPPGARYVVSEGGRFSLVEAPEAPHVYLAMDDAPLPSNVSELMALHVLAVTPAAGP